MGSSSRSRATAWLHADGRGYPRAGVDEELAVFEHPRSWRGRFLSAPVLSALVAALWLFVFPGPDGMRTVAIAAFIWTSLVVLSITLGYGRIFASTISVSDHGLTAARYVGRPKQILWQDVATVERRSRRRVFGLVGGKTALRITDGRRGGSIVFTDAISDFDDLVGVIEERVPAARHVRMPLIWRLIL